MSWIRLDDQVPQHPKVLRAGAASAWLWVCGIAYCSRHLTDGFVPGEALSTFGVPGHGKLAARLVEVGLWERAANGYRVHDYHAYNDRAEDVKARRRETASRVAKWKRERRGNSVTSVLPSRSNIESGTDEERAGNAPPTPTPVPSTPPKPPQGGPATMRPAQLRKRAEEIRSRMWGRCQHDPECGAYDVCIARIVEDLRAGQADAFTEASA